MNWIDYWTLFLQIVLGCIGLALPVAFFVWMIVGSFRMTGTKKQTTKIQ